MACREERSGAASLLRTLEKSDTLPTRGGFNEVLDGQELTTSRANRSSWRCSVLPHGHLSLSQR